VEPLRDGIVARCDGVERAYRVDGVRRRALSGADRERRLARLRGMLDVRLGVKERAYRSARYLPPTVPFLVRMDSNRLDRGLALRCLVLGDDTPVADLERPGWFATERGLALTLPGAAPAAIRVDAPPGNYAVEAATVPVPPPPWLFGTRRWRRRAFQ